MFTRSMFQTPDMTAQSHLLQQVAQLIETGKIKTTLNQVMGSINAENIRQAHHAIESEKTQGKLVLEGF
jgi:NADPH2:quinone reductase